MQQILVYGDSLTWGIIPNTRYRFPFETRWPGIVEMKLNDPHSGARKASDFESAGLKLSDLKLGGMKVDGALEPVRVIEDCLNGRRTVWDDAFRPGRNGLTGLAQRIEINSPLSLVILMLGTNDFQFSHPHNNAWSAAQGISTLVQEIRRAPVEPGMPTPEVLIVSPPPINAKGTMAEKFAGAETRCEGLAKAYCEIAASLGCHFFDAASVTASSTVDGVHLDENQHLALGNALAPVVGSILAMA